MGPLKKKNRCALSCLVTRNPVRHDPVRAFSFSIHMRRCFICPAMPLQPAVRADPGRHSSVWDPTIRVTSCMIYRYFRSSGHKNTQFQRNSRDYSAGDSRAPLRLEGRHQTRKMCLYRLILPAVTNCLHLSSLGTDDSLFWFRHTHIFLPSLCSPRRHIVTLCVMNCASS